MLLGKRKRLDLLKLSKNVKILVMSKNNRCPFYKNELFCIKKSLMQCAPHAKTEVRHMPRIAGGATFLNV